MLKQCDGGQRDSVEVEELLEALCKALWSKSYLLVFDGIWDINLDWYFRLKERLQWCNKSIQSRLIIITTRLHGVAKRMVGPNNLYRIQPFSDEDIWLNIETFISAWSSHCVENEGWNNIPLSWSPVSCNNAPHYHGEPNQWRGVSFYVFILIFTCACLCFDGI